MDWREADESEARLVKRKVISGERWGIALFVFLAVAMLSAVPLGIMTIVRKGNVPFAILSILVQLMFVGLAWLSVSCARDCALKIRLVKGGEYQVTDAVVESVKTSGNQRRAYKKFTVRTSTGAKMTFKKTFGSNLRSKGRAALVVRYNAPEGKKIDKDLVLLNKEDK